jgi:hypothetical protein
VSDSILLPEGLPLDVVCWDRIPPVVCRLVLHLLEVIHHQQAQLQQQDARIKTLEARIEALLEAISSLTD